MSVTEQPWDPIGICRKVGARLYALQDRVSALMPLESAADAQVWRLRNEVAALGHSIAVVEEAGGDATRLREQLEPLPSQLGSEERTLARLREELRLVRYSLKWA